MATKKNRQIPFGIPLLIALLSFILGGIVTYLVITSTNYLPIDYGKKFEQLYKEHSQDNGWETYVDLAYGFIINYPQRFTVTTDYNSNPQKEDRLGSLLQINAHANSPLYDATTTLWIYKLHKPNLLDFAKKDPSHPENTTFTKRTINGYETIIADFTSYEAWNNEQVAMAILPGAIKPEPIKRKIAYIRYKNFVYVLKSGSLFSENEVERFEKILNSLKFIY